MSGGTAVDRDVLSGRAGLLIFVRTYLEHDLGKVDDLHLPGCVRHSTDCDCGWPDQLRAGIEIKRTLLGQHAPVDVGGRVWCARCRWSVGHDAVAAVDAHWPCLPVRLLASEWTGLPGWRAEWANRKRATETGVPLDETAVTT